MIRDNNTHKLARVYIDEYGEVAVDTTIKYDGDDIINNNTDTKTQIRAQFHLGSDNTVDKVHIFVVKDENDAKTE